MVRNAECMVRNADFMVCITLFTPRNHGFTLRILVFTPRNTAENNQCIILPVDGYMMH